MKNLPVSPCAQLDLGTQPYNGSEVGMNRAEVVCDRLEKRVTPLLLVFSETLSKKARDLPKTLGFLMKPRSADSLNSSPSLLSPGSQDAKQVKAAPAGAAIQSRAGEIQNKALRDPSFFEKESEKDAAGGPGAPADPGR